MRPGEKPPTLPPNAKENIRVGASDFAFYWFQALDWGYATTDSTLARSLYLPECKDCAEFMLNFDETKAKGRHFKGGRSRVVSRQLASEDHRHPGTTAVDVALEVGALRTIDAKGRTVSSAPAYKKLRYRIWLKWLGKRWAVFDTKRVVTK